MERSLRARRQSISPAATHGSAAGLRPSSLVDSPSNGRIAAAKSRELRFGETIARQTIYTTKGKRALDLALVVASLPAVVPLVLGAAAVISLDGGSPFFVQRRVGRGGREFGCIKLRTMVVDAESRLNRLLARDRRAASEWAATRKLRKDPRVTRLGHFLRKTSLDELPQVWNVLRGEMSLVGPRPVVPEELEQYGRSAVDYKAVRPGLTGVWQVSGRNSISYEKRVALDVDYVRGMNFPTDLAIIARTFFVVFKRSGM